MIRAVAAQPVFKDEKKLRPELKQGDMTKIPIRIKEFSNEKI